MLVIAVFNKQITTEILNIEVLQQLCVSLLLESFKFLPKTFLSRQLHVVVSAMCLPLI